MADTVGATSGEEGESGESSWDRIARKRRQRALLDQEISAETPTAVDAAQAAGLRVADLAKLWGVTEAWIYTVAPRRKKDRGQGEGSDEHE